MVWFASHIISAPIAAVDVVVYRISKQALSKLYVAIVLPNKLYQVKILCQRTGCPLTLPGSPPLTFLFVASKRMYMLV